MSGETKIKKQYLKPEVTRHPVHAGSLCSYGGGILLTVMIASGMKPQIVVRNNTGSNDSLYTLVCSYVCRELNISEADIIFSSAVFDKSLSRMEGGLASIHRFAPKVFGINIDVWGRNSLIKSVIHELFHVKQMLENRLVITPKAVWFEGTLYTAKTDYEKLPYEKEARELAGQFYMKHRKELKKFISNH